MKMTFRTLNTTFYTVKKSKLCLNWLWIEFNLCIILEQKGDEVSAL